MTKKGISLFIGIVISMLPKTYLSAKNFNLHFYHNHHDTVLIKKYVDLGDQYKSSIPDSGIYFYSKALSIIEKKGTRDKQMDHFFALVHLKLATLYADMRKAEYATTHNAIALANAKKINSKQMVAELLNNKGLIYSFKSDYDSATYFYRQALTLSIELPDKKLEAKIYINLGRIQPNLGNKDSAYIYLKKAIAIAEKIKDKELLAAAYNNLGNIYSNSGNLDEAISLQNKSKNLYEEIKNIVGIIKCENSIANIYFFKCDYVGALERYNIVVDKCLKVNDQLQLAKAYHNIGVSYYNIFACEEATNYYFKSIEIKQKLNDRQGVSSDYISIGNVQISNENPKKALDYYHKALSILMEIDYKPGLAMVFDKIGQVYTELNKPDSAISYLNRAKELAVKAGENYTLSSTYFSFALLYNKTADYQNALLYFNKSIELNEQMDDIETIGMANYKIAAIYNTLARHSKAPSEKRKYHQKARQYADKAFKIAEENQFLEVKAESAKELKNALEGLGDFKQALFYSGVYAQTNDSLYKKKQSEAAINAEARWQAEKKQQQILLLEKEKSLKEALILSKVKENKTQHLVIYLLLGVLVIVIVGSGLIAYLVRKQRKLEYQQQLNKISMLRLENARGRVSPHFLFNCLNTIQDELIDKPEVNRKLQAIVNMLRSSLLNIEKPSITLKEEMEFVDNYLLLQKSKYIIDLQAEINICNEEYDYKVPAMIIQIPVENAIKHGLAGKLNGEKILKVDARRENGTLMISVSDNGIGREKAGSNSKLKGTGTGLKVISQTLHLLNSKNEKKILFSMIDLKNELGENCGTKVDIAIPVDFSFVL